MKQLGFLVVNGRTGFMLETKEHAAKIFDGRSAAQSAFHPAHGQIITPIRYDQVVTSLLKGTAFCFESDAVHARFLGCLRNDPSNKIFLEYSQERTNVLWRHKNVPAKTDTGAGMVPDTRG